MTEGTAPLVCPVCNEATVRHCTSPTCPWAECPGCGVYGYPEHLGPLGHAEGEPLVNADNHDLPAWAVDDDPELAELLARPLEVPEASGSDGQERALVGPVPAPAPSSLALVELEAASVEAVRVLRWALHHGESTRNRIAAARAILGFNLGVWQTAGKVVDPLGDLMRSLIPAAGNGTHG